MSYFLPILYYIDFHVLSYILYIFLHILRCSHQNDLLQLFQPLGVITKLVMLRAKNQVVTLATTVEAAIYV